MNGKGDKRRPRLVDRETYDDNWERAFAKRRRQESARRDEIDALQMELARDGCTQDEIDAIIENRYGR